MGYLPLGWSDMVPCKEGVSIFGGRRRRDPPFSAVRPWLAQKPDEREKESRSPYPFTKLGRPSFRKYLAGRAMVSPGLWLKRQGPWADFAVFHAKSALTPRRFNSR